MRPHTLITLLLSTLAPVIASADLCPVLDARVNALDTDCAHNIATLKPGESVLAKLRCIGCPTVWMAPHNFSSPEERLRVVNYTEENYLIFNLTVTEDKKRLLLNRRDIIPIATNPPPVIYAPQVARNWSVSDLMTTIRCEETAVHHYSSYGECVPNTVGAMELDYLLSSPPRPDPIAKTTEKIAWEVTFDVFGGRDGFMDDPYVTLDSTAQGKLVVAMEESVPSGELRILAVGVRERNTVFYPQEMSWKERIYFFLGLMDDPDIQVGSVIYVDEHWNDDGRVGTFGCFWGGIWNDTTTWIVLTVLGSVTGGLLVLYALYRFVRYVASLPPREGERAWVEDETERLLIDVEDEESVLHKEEPDAPLKSKRLPDKPLPEIPQEEDI